MQLQLAAQCCTKSLIGGPKEVCRRVSKPNGAKSISSEDCVAGMSLAFSGSRNAGDQFEAMTYGQAVEKCEWLGLGLCAQTCMNTGCFYNKNPVYSALPCES
uniref:Uncharacterized protein n=1 Tax=Coccolithus braarudii TaxID=221442 RepID=A0A7S0LB81_9EUKA|mmetsp:Transcript_31004/g.66569  ORF Transcript_31004/g.66569 Transcript_31004/m.66569 type:complete len:102 (+) Transcript_31004:374-679(+)